MLHNTLDERKSPLILAETIENTDIREVQIYKNVLKYLTMLRERQPLTLTQKGNLPRKFCRDLWDSGISGIEMDMEWSENHPISREEDSYHINFLNVVTFIAGLTRKAHRKMQLTRRAETYLDSAPPYTIYRHLLERFIVRYKWGHIDRYPEAYIIQQGFGFSILMVQKYGFEERTAHFYTVRFLKAFPVAIYEFLLNNYNPPCDWMEHCYTLRTFDRFMKIFGLVDVYEGNEVKAKPMIRKRDLIDKVFIWKESR